MAFNPYIFRKVISDDLAQLGTPANGPDMKDEILGAKACSIVETFLSPEQQEIIKAIAAGAKVHPLNRQAAESLRDLAYHFVREKTGRGK